jgi:hypothetical protein
VTIWDSARSCCRRPDRAHSAAGLLVELGAVDSLGFPKPGSGPSGAGLTPRAQSTSRSRIPSASPTVVIRSITATVARKCRLEQRTHWDRCAMRLMICNQNGPVKSLENPSALQLEIAVSNAEPLISTHLPTTGIYG